VTAATAPQRTGRLRGAAPTRLPWQAKFLALVLIWGSSFLLMKVGLRAMAPLQIAGLRIFSGTLILLALLRLAGGRLPRGRGTWWHLMVGGVFMAALPFTLFALGEERVSSALAGIGNATTPLATVVFALLLLPSESVTRRKVVGVVVGFVGVLVIAQPWEVAGRPDLIGFGMTLVAGMSYGLGWTYNRRHLAGSDLGGLTQPAAQLLAAAVEMVLVLVVWSLVRGAAPWTLQPGTAGGSVLLPILAVLALGLVGTGIAFSLQFDVVRAAGPTVASTITYVIPVVSVALGAIFLAERLSWPQYLGAAIVVGAAALTQRHPRVRRASVAGG
jgi:drug/metabolite transporter (DMT)-like permease